jgi:hypothetical protein
MRIVWTRKLGANNYCDPIHKERYYTADRMKRNYASRGREATEIREIYNH